MSTDGLPTPDDRARYETLRAELLKSLEKKRTVDKQLANIELQIYNLESQYLTETAAHSGGNIIQGFEGYLKNQTVTRRKYEVSEQDRIFSNSSSTLQKSLELMADGDESLMPDEYGKQSTPGLTTVVVPPAPRTQELTPAQSKKLRDKEYQRKKRASVSRRSTGTISDDEQISARRPTKRARLADDD
ncbi:hypothetical protein PC9H_000905 [Pleurotus ostreatus]|uniref:Chromatin modification-related protein EAF6 n=1 Tax=Pleurotus ostreatus TaxID=5322 RepID=A0A8H7A4D8_PLEOS|nr:uncharacterized protein PC9H_000905 [Pleurotus ostreatus]KAF7440559.1 hypothetical protein PC9H_000905 [Pleurotus ostreatus]KAJ8700079.1 chromatin modification- protein eaf6 [Pleurotus ostreatus]